MEQMSREGWLATYMFSDPQCVPRSLSPTLRASRAAAWEKHSTDWCPRRGWKWTSNEEAAPLEGAPSVFIVDRVVFVWSIHSRLAATGASAFQGKAPRDGLSSPELMRGTWYNAMRTAQAVQEWGWLSSLKRVYIPASCYRQIYSV